MPWHIDIYTGLIHAFAVVSLLEQLSTKGNRVHKIYYYLRLFWLSISWPFRKTYTANICGHHTKKTGKVVSHGVSHQIGMPLANNGNPDYCLKCIGEMSIKCAWCKSPINIGDPVTLYIPNESSGVPSYAVRYDKDPRCLVGCLGWNCASTGGDRQGFWVPPGKVKRVPSPIEMLMEGGSETKAVVIGDLSDPSDLGQVIK